MNFADAIHNSGVKPLCSNRFGACESARASIVPVPCQCGSNDGHLGPCICRACHAYSHEVCDARHPSGTACRRRAGHRGEHSAWGEP